MYTSNNGELGIGYMGTLYCLFLKYKTILKLKDH